ncbi:uncharacterized protein LOC111206923 [Brassica napus]|uniref:uncharacterized protein LOC111206923 n=1 Tax=Brassica napus TaxID=3708 RepID=UPI002078F443|nr:uncharacterized protein LOC111206923 [Brassica napus]
MLLAVSSISPRSSLCCTLCLRAALSVGSAQFMYCRVTSRSSSITSSVDGIGGSGGKSSFLLGGQSRSYLVPESSCGYVSSHPLSKRSPMAIQALVERAVRAQVGKSVTEATVVSEILIVECDQVVKFSKFYSDVADYLFVPKVERDPSDGLSCSTLRNSVSSSKRNWKQLFPSSEPVTRPCRFHFLGKKDSTETMFCSLGFVRRPINVRPFSRISSAGSNSGSLILIRRSSGCVVAIPLPFSAVVKRLAICCCRSV